MKKNWFGYAVLAILLATFAMLWVSIGDSVGAILSLIVIGLVGTLIVAVTGYSVSNVPAWLRSIRGVSWEDHLENMVRAGTAIREEYKASGALTFDDLNTGCIVHLIDVGENTLLCLYGQDYYHFEPHDDGPDINQPRLFPTTEFSLLRHAKQQDVLNLYPGTDVLDPVVLEPIVDYKALHDLGIQLDDGELISSLRLQTVRVAVEAGAKPA